MGAVLAAAFILGFAAEATSLFDEFWPDVVVAVIAPLVLLLTVALTASLDEKVTFMSAVVSGLAAGCFTGMVFVLGVVSPFALELGERELNNIASELSWQVAITLGLIIWGTGGAALGTASGAAAWALRLGLGQMRSERERGK